MIGGNITATLQVSTTTKNAIGESVKVWNDVWVHKGWLDLLSGDSRYNTYDAKIQESTHIFVCDFNPIPDTFIFDDKTIKVEVENTRMVANSKQFDVMLIDDPMEMHKQLEIFLKYTGGC